ncbi:ribonuclease H-like domain-containing protein [Tanacetum coccineum]
MVTRFRVETNRPTKRLNLHVSSVSPLPKSYRDAFSDPNWQNAMRDEYHALIKNKTWTLVPRSPDNNIVHYMWLFGHKYLADGTLSRYKACLVANGSTQLEGVDVDETFSPVVKPGTIWIVLSLAASRHWPIHQIDVKNAFLHGDLSKTVYMHQPPGFQDSVHPDYVSEGNSKRETPKEGGGGEEGYAEGGRCSVKRKDGGEGGGESGGRVGCWLGAEGGGEGGRWLGGAVEKKLENDGTYSLREQGEADWQLASETDLQNFHYTIFEHMWAGIQGLGSNYKRRCGDGQVLFSVSLFYLVGAGNISMVAAGVMSEREYMHDPSGAFITALLENGSCSIFVVRVFHVPSRYQYADIFTKGLPSALFEEFRTSLSAWCPPAPTEGGC